MKKIFLTMALAIGLMGNAQVKIGANPTSINAASLLELESTTQGVLFPRVTLTSTLTPTLAGGAHVQGMTVYNLANTGDVTEGMYTNDGIKWVKLGGSTTPAYQNIGGGVQNLTTDGPILDTTYFVLFTGSTASTLTSPTPIAGKTFHVRTTSTGTVTVAGITVGTGKGRSFVSDGTTWYALVP